METANPWLYTILALLLGGYAFGLGTIQAHQAQSGSAPLSLPEYLALLVVRLIRGREAEAHSRSRLSQPERMKRSALNYRIIGGVLLFIGFVQLLLMII